MNPHIRNRNDEINLLSPRNDRERDFNDRNDRERDYGGEASHLRSYTAPTVYNDNLDKEKDPRSRSGNNKRSD